VTKADSFKAIKAAAEGALGSEVIRPGVYGNLYDPPEGSPGNGRRKRAYHRALKRKDPNALMRKQILDSINNMHQRVIQAQSKQNDLWQSMRATISPSEDKE